MKTLFSIFVIAVAAMTISCAGNANTATETEVTDSVTVVVDSTACCADSTACCADSTATEKTECAK